MKLRLLFAFAGFANALFGQPGTEPAQTQTIPEVLIFEQQIDVKRLPEIQATYLYSGKKTEVISLADANLNIADKVPRQVFAKIPGIFVYDMDGTGNQTNISTRGLDPHRGWEFNIRKNGVIVNSDVYGYPASHFSLPFEAIDRVELVRGTGSLQYGAQFGGMLNYVVKQADTTRKFGLESINSVGSFGLLSTFNAIGGKIGKFEYYGFFSKRVSDGYRDNSKSDYDGQFFSVKYRLNDRLAIGAELARSNYIYQIPGPLNDSMFHENPRQATRSRNYFNPEIYVPSVNLDWKIGANTRLSWVNSMVLGDRRSVQFDKPSNIVDAIDPVTLQFAVRQVDIDGFNSFTSELRLLQHYNIGKIGSTLVAGAQVFDNDLHRTQLGKGTTGSDFDMTITGDWGRDLHFKSKNLAVFAENKFDFTKNWSLTAGLRFETGASKMSGKVSYLEPADIPNEIKHEFPLFGASTNYQISETQNFYAGFSQAYRPVIFKDIIAANVNERSDKNLEDAFGYNLDAGYRGSFGGFRWDLSVFMLQYNNRLGSLSVNDGGNFYLFRTNIGDSRTRGVEAFLEKNIRLGRGFFLNMFTSTAYFDGKYQDAQVRSGNENKSVEGNHIESVPEWISRNGLTLKYQKWGFSTLYSYTAKSYADALNTEKPSANGSVGLVPAYGLVDMNLSCKIFSNLTARLSASNVLDKQYFTKRPSFYPGPGVWSSDGRSVNVSVSVKI